MPLKVAVFGHGLSATVFHLPYLLQHQAFEIVGISTRQAEAARLYPHLHIANDPATLLEHVRPDLVVVTTPNATHAQYAEMALHAGCHVVVEKPVCLDIDTARRLHQLAATKQKLLVPFFNRRWDDDFIALQHIVHQGALGELRLFYSRFDRFRPHAQARWKENAEFGSGVFWDLAPHLIDQMLQLFGKPLAVTAQISAVRQGSPCDDYFQLCFEYPTTLVHLGSSPYQAGPVVRFDLQGEAGSAQSFGFDPQEQRLRQPQLNEMPRQLQIYTEQGTLQMPLSGGDYGAFYQQVAMQCLAMDSRVALLPTMQQAMAGLCCMEAALQSSALGSKVAVVYNSIA